MPNLNSSGPGSLSRPLILYWAGVLLAVFTYFFGLESDHIPKNGDEFVYLNITRLTALSGHWLPLQAGDAAMRNTKPPLLFWQGIACTSGGKAWTLWRLRFPSVIYTLLTALLVALLAGKISRQRETGFLAFLVFLAFFGTYRFGRPYLTDSALIFWLFVPLFVLLYWQPVAFASRLLVPLLIGLALGIGSLYKSPALAVPAILGLSIWYLAQRDYQLRPFVRHDAGKLIVIGTLVLGVFSLWFLLDPEPQAIWKGFIVGENLKKFDPHGGSYVSKLLWGQSSIWRVMISYPVDAGLLAFPVTALSWLAFRRRNQMEATEKLLWIWVVILFVIFSLPSQRDERYLLPGMPALAVLCALNWQRINRMAFVATLIAAAVVLAVLAFLSVRLQIGAPGTPPYSPAYWGLLCGAGVWIFAAIFNPKLTVPGACIGAILVSLSFAAFVRPLDGPLGTYNEATQERVRGREVGVPVNFRAKAEGYRFFLPGAEVYGYDYNAHPTAAELSARYPIFALRLPMTATNPAIGRVIGERVDLGSRNTPEQIMEMIRGKVFEHLFLKELLIETSTAQTNAPARPLSDP